MTRAEHRTNVLLVIDSLAPGGAEQSTVELLPLLTERGYDLTLATLHDRRGLQDQVAAAGVGLHELSSTGGRPGWIRQLRTLIGQSRPRLVHTSLYESDICGRLAAASHRVPVVSTIPTERYGPAHLNAPNYQKTKIRAAQSIDILTARLTRRLHAVSTHIAQTTAKNLLYPTHRIDVIYRGRSAALANRPDVDTRRLRAAVDANPGPIVVAVARLDHAKGLDRLLAAWPRVTATTPQATLLIAGSDADQANTLRQTATSLAIDRSVRFLGYRTDIADLLAISQAFVLPSRREGLPGALLEAMAAGTPAIVTDLPQVREVVTPSDALIIDAGNPTSLADAITTTLTDSSSAEHRAERARKRFLQHFTLDRSADGIADFYHRSLQIPDRTSR